MSLGGNVHCSNKGDSLRHPRCHILDTIIKSRRQALLGLHAAFSFLCLSVRRFLMLYNSAPAYVMLNLSVVKFYLNFCIDASKMGGGRGREGVILLIGFCCLRIEVIISQHTSVL